MAVIHWMWTEQKARVIVLPWKAENFPEQCPSCGTRLTKDAGISAQQLRWALRASEKDSVMLRVYEATLEK